MTVVQSDRVHRHSLLADVHADKCIGDTARRRAECDSVLATLKEGVQSVTVLATLREGVQSVKVYWQHCEKECRV